MRKVARSLGFERVARIVSLFLINIALEQTQNPMTKFDTMDSTPIVMTTSQ